VVFEELGSADNDYGAWSTFSTSLNAFAGQTIYLLVEAADAGTASLVEAALEDVTIGLTSTTPPPPPTPTYTPPPSPTWTPAPSTPTPSATPLPPTITPLPTSTPAPQVVFSDDFETDLGWVRNPFGSDTATTGLWERGDPQDTSWGQPLQLGTTVSGTRDLVTGALAGSTTGEHDVDGGVTSIRSPDISLPSAADIQLSFFFYLAHLSNSSPADFLRVRVYGADTSAIVFEELGSADDDFGGWDSVSVSLNAFAGETIYLLIEAADAGGGSLVEAAVDDVSILASGP
jgi:hypothetical protein